MKAVVLPALGQAERLSCGTSRAHDRPQRDQGPRRGGRHQPVDWKLRQRRACKLKAIDLPPYSAGTSGPEGGPVGAASRGLASECLVPSGVAAGSRNHGYAESASSRERRTLGPEVPAKLDPRRRAAALPLVCSRARSVVEEAGRRYKARKPRR